MSEGTEKGDIRNVGGVQIDAGSLTLVAGLAGYPHQRLAIVGDAVQILPKKTKKAAAEAKGGE